MSCQACCVIRYINSLHIAHPPTPSILQEHCTSACLQMLEGARRGEEIPTTPVDAWSRLVPQLRDHPSNSARDALKRMAVVRPCVVQFCEDEEVQACLPSGALIFLSRHLRLHFTCAFKQIEVACQFPSKSSIQVISLHHDPRNCRKSPPLCVGTNIYQRYDPRRRVSKITSREGHRS